MKISSKNHKITKYAYIFSIILISGCSNTVSPVLVSIPENLQMFWNTIIKDNPLPEKLQLIYENPENTLIPEIRININYNKKTSISNNIILLETKYLVPCTNFDNTKTDIKNNELSNFKLLSLDEIKLPVKGLSIEGLYPGDTNYPVFEEKVLSLHFPDNYTDKNKLKLELTSWFENVKLYYRQMEIIPPEINWVAGTGDIMTQRGIETNLLYKNNGSDYIFGDTLSILQNQDLMIGNLEGSITYSNTKTPKSYNFKFDKNVLPILKEAGFDYFSITNNHIYDYGEPGFRDTLNFLKEADIPTSGAGLTKTEASEYTEFIFNNNIFRVLSFGAYPQEKNGWDGRTMAQVSDTRPGILFESELTMKAVKNMTSSSSFDIVMIHGGKEWSSVPNENQKNIYRSYIDAGVDIIFGSHPHVLQGMEEWKGKLIAYSLGNFIFPGMGSMKYAEESMILSVGVYNNEIKYIKPIPVKIDNQRLSIDKSGNILERFENLSKDL